MMKSNINWSNLIDNYIELITDRIKSSLFEFDKYVFSLKNLKDSILLIYSFSEEVSKKLIILLIYKNLLKVSSIQQIFNCLFLNYKENKNQFDIQLLNLKNSDSFLLLSYNCIPNITFLFIVIPFNSNSCPLWIIL